MTIDMGAVE